MPQLQSPPPRRKPDAGPTPETASLPAPEPVTDAARGRSAQSTTRRELRPDRIRQGEIASPPSDLKASSIADAVRLLRWGKSWHELADLIGRMAERPSAAGVVRSCGRHKTEIEEKATVSAGRPARTAPSARRQFLRAGWRGLRAAQHFGAARFAGLQLSSDLGAARLEQPSIAAAYCPVVSFHALLRRGDFFRR